MIKKSLAAVAAGAISVSMALPAAAEPTKFDFWFGLSGDLARVVDTMCKNFNASQADYEVVCTSQGNYDATLQNTIAAFRVVRKTGGLAFTGHYAPVGNPSHVVFLDLAKTK